MGLQPSQSGVTKCYCRQQWTTELQCNHSLFQKIFYRRSQLRSDIFFYIIFIIKWNFSEDFETKQVLSVQSNLKGKFSLSGQNHNANLTLATGQHNDLASDKGGMEFYANIWDI